MYFKNYTWIPGFFLLFFQCKKLYKLNAKPSGPHPYRGYHNWVRLFSFSSFWVLNSPLLSSLCRVLLSPSFSSLQLLNSLRLCMLQNKITNAVRLVLDGSQYAQDSGGCKNPDFLNCHSPILTLYFSDCRFKNARRISKYCAERKRPKCHDFNHAQAG